MYIEVEREKIADLATLGDDGKAQRCIYVSFVLEEYHTVPWVLYLKRLGKYTKYCMRTMYLARMRF